MRVAAFLALAVPEALGFSVLGRSAVGAAPATAPASSSTAHSARQLLPARRSAIATALPSMRAPLERLEMASKPLKVGVVGVTGAVGKEIIDVLGNRKFPVEELKLFASARSAGKPMETPFGELPIEEFTLEAARACDVVFLAVSGDFALECAPKPIAAAAPIVSPHDLTNCHCGPPWSSPPRWVPKLTADDGPLVIDNSSAYRYDDEVPLVVPEINAEVAPNSKPPPPPTRLHS